MIDALEGKTGRGAGGSVVVGDAADLVVGGVQGFDDHPPHVCTPPMRPWRTTAACDTA